MAGGRPEISLRQVAALVPYARNSRTHSDAQVAQIAASIREFGWTNPVLIDGQTASLPVTVGCWQPVSWA
jgi:ParB-like chromosome segregation protein Spo0J